MKSPKKSLICDVKTLDEIQVFGDNFDFPGTQKQPIESFHKEIHSNV